MPIFNVLLLNVAKQLMNAGLIFITIIIINHALTLQMQDPVLNLFYIKLWSRYRSWHPAFFGGYQPYNTKLAFSRPVMPLRSSAASGGSTEETSRRVGRSARANVFVHVLLGGGLQRILRLWCKIQDVAYAGMFALARPKLTWVIRRNGCNLAPAVIKNGSRVKKLYIQV